MNVKQILRSIADKVGLYYVQILCRREYHSQRFVSTNERPVEFRFLFRHLVQLYPQTILDVGTGATALPHLMRNCGFLVTATDNIRDYWPFGMINRHYHVIQDDITDTQLHNAFDLITCISVLEHIRDHTAAVRSMFKLLKPGGSLILTCPYNEQAYVENVYALPQSSVKDHYPFITQAFSRRELDAWLLDNGGRIVDQEYWRFYKGEYWTCGEPIRPPVHVSKENRHQLTCILIQKGKDTTT